MEIEANDPARAPAEVRERSQSAGVAVGHDPIPANRPPPRHVIPGEDEERLVQQVLNGDGRAFGKLVGAYERALFNVALRMVNDVEDAHDVVQAALVKAYRKLDTYNRRNKFFSWIYRITINEALDLLRRRKAAAPLDARWSSEAPGPEAQCEEGEVRHIVHLALMQLHTEQRELIILRHLLQMSYREMSHLLHVPEKTIKSRLFNARQALAKVLKRRGFGPS